MKWWYLLLGLAPVPVGFQVDEWTDSVIHATVTLYPLALVLLGGVLQSRQLVDRLFKQKNEAPVRDEHEGVHGGDGPGVCKED